MGGSGRPGEQRPRPLVGAHVSSAARRSWARLMPVTAWVGREEGVYGSNGFRNVFAQGG